MREIHFREVVEITEAQRIENEKNDRLNRNYLEIKPEGKAMTTAENKEFWNQIFNME